MKIYLGRHVYGLAAVAFGVITLVWHDFNTWQQICALGNVPHREILVYLAAAIELFGGLTTMLIGFGLLVWLPALFAHPHLLINWAGNAQNLAITGAAWIVADFLSQNRSTSMAS
jgi:hypothetical protein